MKTQTESANKRNEVRTNDHNRRTIYDARLRNVLVIYANSTR
jgi:hypothetical protein